MIVRPRFSWWQAIATLRGSTVQAMWGRLVGVIVVAVAVTVAHDALGMELVNLTPVPFTLVGLALSIFLGFRNNTSYDRFWEGRKLWGALVNTARTLTRDSLTLVGPKDRPGDEGDAAALDLEVLAWRERQVRAMAAYAHLLRLHLRDDRDHTSLAHLLPTDRLAALDQEHNRPVALLQWMANDLRSAWERGWVHDLHLPTLQSSLTELTNIQGGCERIKATPIPFSYTVLIHRIVGIYCLGLPFGLVATVGALTPVVVSLVAYAFFGLDVVGDEIEDPFGLDDNDLPLSALSRMIEVDVRKRLGDADLPPLLKPVNHLLQ